MKKTLAIVFDFDITLSPYYQQKKIIEKWGIDEKSFWEKCTSKVTEDDYDMEHGHIKVLLEYIQSNQEFSLSNKELFELGKSITLYDGLTKKDGKESIFDDLEKVCQEGGYTLECYVISGGLTEMILGALEGNNLSKYFKEVFACSLDEDENGVIYFPKETVGHTIKTQKLFQISKGLEKNVNEPVDNPSIPFQNIIYLGDGETDIPAFSLVNQKGGISIAVYREEKNYDGSINETKTKKRYKTSYDLTIKTNRVKDLLPANYQKDKPLYASLLSHAQQIIDNNHISETLETPSIIKESSVNDETYKEWLYKEGKKLLSLFQQNFPDNTFLSLEQVIRAINNEVSNISNSSSSLCFYTNKPLDWNMLNNKDSSGLFPSADFIDLKSQSSRIVLTTQKIHQMKTKLHFDDFIQLCEDVTTNSLQLKAEKRTQHRLNYYIEH